MSELMLPGSMPETTRKRLNGIIDGLRAAMTVNVKTFGAVGDGVTDDTLAFQNAATFANTTQYRGELFVPPGEYVISSTVELGSLSLRGVGAGSRIHPAISDGSPVFNFIAGTNFFAVSGITVDSEIDGASFETGAIDAQNCTGFRVQSSGTYSARFVMRDVIVRGCKVGHDITGFIATLENVWAYYCETGLIGTTMNSSRMHLRFEQCRKDIALSDSDGVHIDQMISEGAVLQSGLVSSTFDDCRSLVINALYLEQVRDVPFITFGGTTLCTGVTINSVFVAMSDNASANYDIFPLAFDKVNGLDITGYFSTGAHHNRYSTTSNTKNVRDNTINSATDAWGPHDASKNIGPARNLFPNPNFDLWFRGWPRIDVVRNTVSQETSILRRGRNAMRMTMTAAQANGYVAFRFDDSYLGVKLAGKTVTAYAWIWVPNTADFSPQAGASQPAQVDLGIFFDGTGTTTTRSQPASTARGAWNLFRVTTTLPSDCTRIDIMPRILINSGSASGSEYIVVDSIYLIEGDGGQDQHIANGWIMDSELLQTIGIGGRMLMRSDSAPTDTDMTFEVGDEVRKFTVAAGGSPGWVCTTAGAGGTAVFKALAAVAA